MLTGLTSHDQSNAVLDAWHAAVFAKNSVKDALEESGRIKTLPLSSWALVELVELSDNGRERDVYALGCKASKRFFNDIEEKWLVEYLAEPGSAAAVASSEQPLRGKTVLDSELGRSSLMGIWCLHFKLHLLTDEQETQIKQWRTEILTSTSCQCRGIDACIGESEVLDRSEKGQGCHWEGLR
eukprot:5282375-Amphidinium_carterae.1